MIDLTKGRNKQCKSNVSGVNHIYLFPFVKYLRSQIIRTGLELTSFPATNIYRFDGVNLSFTNSQQEEDGGKFYNENLTADFIGLETNTELVKLINKDYRIIIKDNNGLYRLLGAYNGVLTEFSNTTGSTQAEFSGYNLTFEGKERQEALYIDDLASAGFVVVDSENYILLENGTFILTELNETLILE